ncbi:MAG: agmatinase [Desulfobacter sp.]
MTKYQPVDPLESPRFSGVRTFMRLPNLETLTDVDFIVAGIPFDTGCTYGTGSRFGPQAIREVSGILKSFHPVLDVNVFEHCSGVDYGDITTIPGFIEETYEKIEQGLFPVFEKKVIPVCLGGDHSVTLAELRAAARVYGPMAIVHFDAHSDTGDSYFGKPYNHGTFFRRAIEENLIRPENAIQVGLRGPLYDSEQFKFAEDAGVELLTNWQVRQMGMENTIARIRDRIKNGPVFVTFDIDFLDAAYAPGTGTPEICGFSTWEAQQLVLEGLKGADFVGFDLVEVLPSGDSPGKITAFAAAGIVFDFISLIAFNKKEGKYLR